METIVLIAMAIVAARGDEGDRRWGRTWHLDGAGVRSVWNQPPRPRLADPSWGTRANGACVTRRATNVVGGPASIPDLVADEMASLSPDRHRSFPNRDPIGASPTTLSNASVTSSNVITDLRDGLVRSQTAATTPERS